MTNPNPQESGAAYQSRAAGISLAALGAVCSVVGVVFPFVFDMTDPMSPAIGANGLLLGGVLFILLGAGMFMVARDPA